MCSGVGGTARGGFAIGDHCIDLAAIVSLLNGEAKQAAVAASGPTLNPLMALGAGPRRALRRALFVLLTDSAKEDTVRPALYQAADCTDRKSTRLNSSNYCETRMQSSA